MDESDGLENRCGGNVTVGSNPTLSASFRHQRSPQMYILRASFLAYTRERSRISFGLTGHNPAEKRQGVAAGDFEDVGVGIAARD